MYVRAPNNRKIGESSMDGRTGEDSADSSSSSNDSKVLMFHLYEDNFLLEEIDKVIKERWKTIARTTRYGWLAAYSYRKTILREDAKVLSSLANKVGFENCGEAVDRIRRTSQHLHPRDIPAYAISVLDETYTMIMLRCETTERRQVERQADQGSVPNDLHNF